MAIGTGLGLLIGGLISGGASAAAGKKGATAAKNAAQIQADAANRSAEMQLTAQRETNQLYRDIYGQQTELMRPWYEQGSQAVRSLGELTQPGGRLVSGYGKTFEAPAEFDQSKVTMDPGFSQRMDQSQKAILRWASAGGKVGSTGTANKLVRNAQDYTSNEYQNAFARQYGLYDDAFKRSFGLFDDARSQFYNDQANEFNRLSQLAGAGQNAAGANAAAGGAFAANTGSNILGTARNVGATLEGGANANAAGQVGAANSWINALSNIANTAMSTMSFNSLLPQNRQPRPPVQYDTNFMNPGYAVG